MKTEKFYINDSAYIGVHDPSVSWNGFAVPYFTKEVAEKILKDQNIPYAWEGKINSITPNGDLLCFDDTTVKPTTIDEKIYYSVGGYEWTWEIATILEPFTEQIPSQQIAIEFSRILNEWLTADELAEINRLNATPEYKHACATHNYCDPNEAMIQAFKTVTGKEIDVQSEADSELIDQAWTIARDNYFH